jgi:MIP family channel proteins
MYSTPQKLSAEFLGTFALVFFAVGALCANSFLHDTGSGLLGAALAEGLAAAILFTALGRVSGGHFNPAVTIGFWVTKRISTLEVVGYWIAQLVGAIAAAYVLRWMIPDDTWTRALGGTPMLAPDFTRLPAMALEAIITFFLVLVFFATSSGEEGHFSALAGWAIGLVYAAGTLVAGPITGAALNPARAFGPALVSSHWNNHGVYWVGPLAGGFVAGLLYDALFARKS